MCERTTGFGNASTLASQQLSSSGEYLDAHNSTQLPKPEVEQSRPRKRKMTMPKFDMNLKDLFSDEEISNRPLTHQPKLHGFRGQSQQTNNSNFYPLAQTASYPSQTDSFNSPSTNQSSSFTNLSPQLNPALTLSNQQPYAPLAETISHSDPSFSFDDMSFLDTFPVSDPNPGSWGGWGGGMNDLDLGFGTGGMGCYDANGNWDPNGFDMFGGLFFGGDGAAGGL